MYQDNSPSMGALMSIMLPIIIIAVIIACIIVICRWILFQKAGKPGWAAIVPVYNVIIMIEIAGKPIWWILLFLIPVVNVVMAIWILNLFVKSFGKNEGWTLGMLFLPVIFYPIMAFSKDIKYVGNGQLPVTTQPV